MIKNYLVVAFRNLRKHKFYSVINILGLSIGLTCFVLIALYVKDELSYDRFHTDIEDIYRLDFSGSINSSEFITALASAPAGPTLPTEYPEVIDATRLRGTGNWLVRRKEKDITFKEEEVVFADSNFFKFFTFDLLKGDPETVLSRPNTLALNCTTAEKIFGADDPIGQVVVLDNERDYEVTGVYEDLPSNSHFHYDVLLAMEGREEAKSKFWLSFNFNTYLKLKPGTDPNALEAKFPSLIDKYIGPEVEQYMGASLEEFKEAGNYAGFYLFPMKDIHLYSDKLGELEGNSDINYVYLFTAIALFILILACINFMNLATARSANRAKEVGVRKVLGAYRSQLIKQFLSEAFLISLISFVLAISFSYLLLPFFNELASKNLIADDLFTGSFLGFATLFMAVVSLLSGSYPSFYLSRFRPVEVLKGKLNLGLKGGGIRSTLVVIQFCVSIIMIIGTAIVFDQLSFIQNKKLGYDKNQVIMLHDAWLMGDRIEAFKEEMVQDTRIASGTIASFLPVGTINNNNLWFKGKNAAGKDGFVFNNYRIDHDYISTLGMKMVDGRAFSKDFPSDSSAVLINEAAAKQLGFENPIGGFVSTYDGPREAPITVTYKIIGVVKDFHFESLRANINPLIFQLGNNRGYVSFRIQSDQIQPTIDMLRQKWDEFAPGQPFEYSFLDQRFAEMYETEQQIGSIFTVFAGLSIFIACLGLYGLAAFTAEQKNKEIGIRKVLGASISSIIVLLSKEFVKLVIISFVVAAPIAYFGMRTWLDDFQYRTDLSPITFLLAGAMALLVAQFTMSMQSYKAARANPVNSLKDE
ncbi:MAG: ABC transporter permease [Cyclobacteriaceae bacterium]|nr:ABC transporter permease [Cyclobacteriaceae bacterium HetDA_MAG_MS6]